MVQFLLRMPPAILIYSCGMHKVHLDDHLIVLNPEGPRPTFYWFPCSQRPVPNSFNVPVMEVLLMQNFPSGKWSPEINNELKQLATGIANELFVCAAHMKGGHCSAVPIANGKKINCEHGACGSLLRQQHRLQLSFCLAAFSCLIPAVQVCFEESLLPGEDTFLPFPSKHCLSVLGGHQSHSTGKDNNLAELKGRVESNLGGD